MKKSIKFLFLLAAIVISSLANGQDISAIKEVASRVAPWLDGKISCEYVASESGKDYFEIATVKGKLHIQANSVPAAGMGLSHYLKYYCNRSYGVVGSNMAPVKSLPQIKTPVRQESVVKHRHIFNFCTQNYSGSFWDWKDWERVIDVMVLNGVNMTLVPIGLEKVWYNVLTQFHYTKEEILAFLPGPAFNAWHMMANLEGWGGPITERFIDHRAKLARKIFDRLRAYNIEPIHLIFYGMVPSTLSAKYPEATIKSQGRWAGGFLRPSILVPGQPLFDEMASAYYTQIKNLYGEINYFGGEPFHEGGNRSGVDAAELALSVLNKTRAYFPKAKWMLQGWSGNPTPEFLSKLSKNDDVIIWDFRGELSNEWEKSKGYYGYSYMWGVINNYGETPGLYGRLERFNQEFYRALESPYGGNIAGLSFAPEGILNNPVNLSLLFELPWKDRSTDINTWIDQYTQYRYGVNNDTLKQIWEILLQTGYSSHSDPSLIDPVSKVLPTIVGNGESMAAASPRVNLTCASSWGTSSLFYDYKKMKAIIPEMIKVLDKYKKVDAFQYDMVDITRQLISNEFRNLYHLANRAIASGDVALLTQYSHTMLELLDDMDDVLSTRSEFMLGSWLNAAKDMATNHYERQLFEKNARAQITYWGPDHPNTDLRDYAHKEMAGLIKDVHRPRWKSFLEYHIARLNGKEVPHVHNTEFAIHWTTQTNEYADKPQKKFVPTLKNALTKLQNLQY